MSPTHSRENDYVAAAGQATLRADDEPRESYFASSIVNCGRAWGATALAQVNSSAWREHSAGCQGENPFQMKSSMAKLDALQRRMFTTCIQWKVLDCAAEFCSIRTPTNYSARSWTFQWMLENFVFSILYESEESLGVKCVRFVSLSGTHRKIFTTLELSMGWAVLASAWWSGIMLHLRPTR